MPQPGILSLRMDMLSLQTSILGLQMSKPHLETGNLGFQNSQSLEQNFCFRQLDRSWR
jgi:hypothetical protein